MRLGHSMSYFKLILRKKYNNGSKISITLEKKVQIMMSLALLMMMSLSNRILKVCKSE